MLLSLEVQVFLPGGCLSRDGQGAELERLQEQNDALQRMSLQARILQVQAVAVKAESPVWRLSTRVAIARTLSSISKAYHIA